MSSVPLLSPHPCSGLINSTAWSECQPVDSCPHAQLWKQWRTYILHIRGQINSARSRAGDRIDGRTEMDDGAASLITIQPLLFWRWHLLWCHQQNHTPRVLLRSPHLITAPASPILIHRINCTSLICSQYLDVGLVSVWKKRTSGVFERSSWKSLSVSPFNWWVSPQQVQETPHKSGTFRLQD